jgi:hypothetical protein
MIRDRVDIDQLRESLSEVHFEISEILKLCDIVDFAENPSSIKSEYLEISDIFEETEIDESTEDLIVSSIHNGVSTISLLADTLKGSVSD